MGLQGSHNGEGRFLRYAWFALAVFATGWALFFGTFHRETTCTPDVPEYSGGNFRDALQWDEARDLLVTCSTGWGLR
jgi:hypothetical protein